MNQQRRETRITPRLAQTLAVAVAVTALGACNTDSLLNNIGSHTSGYTVTPLVSNKTAIPAANHDANLVNPWGLAFGPAYAWVANNGTQTSTLYDGNGVPQSLVVTIPAGSNGDASPTGLVFNPAATDFMVTANATTGPAAFIYSGEGGTLSAWSAATGFGNAAVKVYDDATGGANYKGLALLNVGGNAFLFATDFHNNKIDTFDNAFHKVTTAGGFVDPDLPAGYVPFGIQAVNDLLIVTYAQKATPDSEDETHGPGLGYVDQFDGTGHFVKRLVSAGNLNAPWGVAMAPADFGALSNTLLIGNFGDGRINAYDPSTGAYIGTMKDLSGNPVEIPGLWALAFGNGAAEQPTNTLFFTAGTNDEADGTYGRIDAAIPGTGGNNGGY